MAALCRHPEPRDRIVCEHLAADDGLSFALRFTGAGIEYHLVCRPCVELDDPPLSTACADCVESHHLVPGDVAAVRGRPEVRSRPAAMAFDHEDIAIPALAGIDVATPTPLDDGAPCAWLAVAGGALVRIDLDQRQVRPVADLSTFGLVGELHVEAAPGGRYAAVVERRGQRGVVVEVETGAVTMRLDRGTYHVAHCDFSLAFFADGERTVLVHATAWNRLDLSDAATGAPLSARESSPWTDGSPTPPAHYLDYFHAGLSISPDGRWLVDDGWIWHPVGVLRRLDLRRWLVENPWESEDGPSRVDLRWCDNHWDGPRAFADARTLVVWGFGADAGLILDAALVFDLELGTRLRWFAGPPRGRFVVDSGWLVVVASDGTTVWDLATGDRVHEAAGFAPHAFHGGRHVAFGPAGVVRVSRLRGD